MKNLRQTFQQVDVHQLVEQFSTPLVLVDEEVIRDRCKKLKQYFPDAQFYYAVKANYNPWILQIILSEGFGVDAVSPREVEIALRLKCLPNKISYVENNMTDEDMEFSVSSLSRLQKYCQYKPNSSIGIRVNGSIEAGHHQKVITSGPLSKFGIDYDDIEKAVLLAANYNVKIETVQQHIGSGMLDPEPILRAAQALMQQIKKMPDVKHIDFGGGFGIPYQPTQNPLDIEKLSVNFLKNFEEFKQQENRNFTYAFEPGRFIIAESSALLARVNTKKVNTQGRTFLGTDSGFNHLIRPAMYGSYHHIINLTYQLKRQQESQEDILYDICGNLCESADFFGRERKLPETNENDILAIMDVGAYGLSMASDYNLRGFPAEILVKEGKFQLIRERQSFEDMMINFKFNFEKENS